MVQRVVPHNRKQQHRCYNRRMIASCLFLLQCLSMVANTLAVHEHSKNVFGMEIEQCSKEGMALTGITGSGHCVHFDELHHYDSSKVICVNIPSFSDAYYTDDDETETDFSPNFFTATGETPLTELPCTEDPTRDCPVYNWCINELSFASYVEYVGGCEKIGRILCEATNHEAISQYELQLIEGTDETELQKINTALECLKFKCWL